MKKKYDSLLNNFLPESLVSEDLKISKTSLIFKVHICRHEDETDFFVQSVHANENRKRRTVTCSEQKLLCKASTNNGYGS